MAYGKILSMEVASDETMTMLFPDFKLNDFAAWEAAAKHVSDRLLTTKDVNGMRWHLQPTMDKAWASIYMKWLATAIVEYRSTDVYEELNRIITRSDVGFMFEAMGHRKLLMSTVDYLLKPLFASRPPGVPLFETARFSLSVVRFKTIDEIGGLTRRNLRVAHDVYLSSRRRRHSARHAHPVHCIAHQAQGIFFKFIGPPTASFISGPSSYRLRHSSRKHRDLSISQRPWRLAPAPVLGRCFNGG